MKILSWILLVVGLLALLGGEIPVGLTFVVLGFVGIAMVRYGG